MTFNVRRGIAGISAALLLAVCAAPMVQAQSTKSSNGYKISPVRSEITIEKGKSSTVAITINNPSKTATTARAIVNDFIASEDESGTPRLILDENVPLPKNDLRKLVEPVADVTLGPNESKQVNVKISVPANANAGGYYGAIRFVPIDTQQESNVGLTASVGTIVLLTVPGNLTEKLNMEQLTASQNGKAKSFITSGDVSITTRLKNDGDIHLQPYGRITVKNMFGRQAAGFELNNTDPRANILPGSVRRFDNKLPKTNWFGRYTIEANLGYSQGGGQILVAKAVFWYIPTWAVGVLVVLLLGLIGAIYWFVRKFQNSHGHRARK